MTATSVTPTPQQLRALTHPVRLRMLGLLRVEGPATSTTLATRLGLNTGATSYHLRQLAQHGFVEEATELGNARDRWWRAAHRSTTTPAPEPADAEAVEAFLQTVAVVYTEQLQRAVEERPLLPEEWYEASTLSDWVIRLTPTRAARLRDALMQVLRDTEQDADDTPDAAHFVVQLAAFPLPGHVGRDQP